MVIIKRTYVKITGPKSSEIVALRMSRIKSLSQSTIMMLEAQGKQTA